MEFGKKICVGNFVLMKKTRALSKKEMKALRDLEKIPEDKRKILSRGTVPYIRVSDVGGGWSLEVSLEHTMFDALDALTVVCGDDGRWTVPGIEGKNAEAVLTGMFVDTTIVGDMEYQKEKVRVMSAYLERATKERLEREAAERAEKEPDKIKEDVEKAKKEAAEASKEAAEAPTIHLGQRKQQKEASEALKEAAEGDKGENGAEG